MNLSEFKKIIKNVTEVNFILPNGQMLPPHFHVTEVGQITKHFIDCGGTVRKESSVNFQLWEADDLDHRLAPQKLNSIIELSEKKLGLEDAEIEVEYQNDTIGKYGVEFDGDKFVLVNKKTNCLASDACGIPQQKPKIKLSDLNAEKSCCNPNTGCSN